MAAPCPAARLRGLWLVAAAAVAAGCADDPPDPHDDAACLKALEDPSAAEAFEWLKDPHGAPKHLGVLDANQALALAHQIEYGGGEGITAVGIRKAEGSAEGLVARLPKDPSRRRFVFELYGKVARGAGLAPRSDVGQAYVYFPAGR